jgi:protocatechuate 3,4-dioxygenase beta subunit
VKLPSRLAALAAAAVLASASLVALEQNAQTKRMKQTGPPAGLVVGRIIDSASSRPISGATVTLGSGPSTPAPGLASTARRVLTDADGRFLFRDLAPGTYTFTVSAFGYLDGGYGQRAPGGSIQPFTLNQDQRVGDLTIRLWKEARLSGTVRDETGTPVASINVSVLRRQVAGGQVRLSPTEGFGGSVRTDDRGAFEFAQLFPGEYVVSVPSRMTQVPAGVMTADSTTLESFRQSGLSALASDMRYLGPMVRLGDFVVQTSPEGTWGGSNSLAAIFPTSLRADGVLVGYATTFHPGTLSPSDAAAIALRSGDMRANVDLELRPTPLSRITGTLSGPTGPQSHFAVHLLPAYAAGQLLERTHETGVTATDANGRFVFLAVPPGQYVLRAWRGPAGLLVPNTPTPADTTLWAEMNVSVPANAPATSVNMDLRQGLTLSGRVVFDGTAAPAPVPRLRTLLGACFQPPWILAIGNVLATNVQAGGEFTTQGLPPGRYFAQLPNRFSTNPGWYFESAKLGDQDLTIVPVALDSQNVGNIVITFSDRRSDLAGVVRDAAGRPAATAAVLAFPADYEAWIRNGFSSFGARVERVAQSGSYSIGAIKPGDYIVAAIADEALATWPEAAAVRRIAAQATRVSIARGDMKVQDLVVVR